MLEAGADKSIHEKDESGMTALMLAVTRGQAELVRILLGAGAGNSLHEKNKSNMTALMLAKEQGRSDIVEFCLKRALLMFMQVLPALAAQFYGNIQGEVE